MSFLLGNHNIDEIKYITAQNSTGDLLYTVDEIANASIEVSADETEVTDHLGNVVRTKYKAKSGTFNSTSSFLHPAIMNAGSGSQMEEATDALPIKMPKFVEVAAGATASIADAVDGVVKVMGIAGNGANIKISAAEQAEMISGTTFTAPTTSASNPAVRYLLVYQTSETSGFKLSNDASRFPDTVKLTCYATYMDPCDDQLNACYVVLPRFVADPNMTINLDSETQEVDFNGKLNIDYCSSTGKPLYYIYYPGSGKLVTGTVENPNGGETGEHTGN